MTTHPATTTPTTGLAAKVLTVSDGVVAGTREDRSGAVLVERLPPVAPGSGRAI